MSDTPRTDREIEDARNLALDFELRDRRVDRRENVYVVSAEFARQLERELESLKQYAVHAPTCPMPAKACDCGLAKLMEDSEKITR